MRKENEEAGVAQGGVGDGRVASGAGNTQPARRKCTGRVLGRARSTHVVRVLELVNLVLEVAHIEVAHERWRLVKVLLRRNVAVRICEVERAGGGGRSSEGRAPESNDLTAG